MNIFYVAPKKIIIWNWWLNGFRNVGFVVCIRDRGLILRVFYFGSHQAWVTSICRSFVTLWASREYGTASWWAVTGMMISLLVRVMPLYRTNVKCCMNLYSIYLRNYIHIIQDIINDVINSIYLHHMEKIYPITQNRWLNIICLAGTAMVVVI